MLINKIIRENWYFSYNWNRSLIFCWYFLYIVKYIKKFEVVFRIVIKFIIFLIDEKSKK